jgi:hypothetical protein
MILQGGGTEKLRETCTKTPLPITNPIWTDQGYNPSLGGKSSATNLLSNGTADIPLKADEVNTLSAFKKS